MNFRVMAARDIELRTRLSKIDTHLAIFSPFKS